MVNTIRLARAYTMKMIKPKENYFLATKSVKPLSNKFGFDRGEPIDRYYIEKFLQENKNLIKGTCLEIGDNRYTKKFGENRVFKSDVLDIDKKNKKANKIANLKNLKSIKSNTYDCLVITHVLGMIDDYNLAISEMKRVLKKGGALLVTVSSFSPSFDIKYNFWRFTQTGAQYSFNKHFEKKNVQVFTFGNVLSGQCFWVGMAQEELKKQELDYNDPHFPCIIAVKAIK